MPVVLPGHETAINEPGTRFARHHHVGAYAALLVEGRCDEAGDRGRLHAGPGDVLVHAAFDGHRDRIGARGATFINFALDAPLSGWFGTVDDLDVIVRLYERDPAAAAELLKLQFRPRHQDESDWPDLLAHDLSADHRFSLEQWADRNGLHPAAVSRGFRLAYGLAPKRYRLERMASRAARRIRDRRDSLSAIASDCGFADQAHMTRTIGQVFGQTPGALRRAR